MINRKLFVSCILLTSLLAVTPVAQAEISTCNNSWNTTFDRSSEDYFATILDGDLAGLGIVDESFMDQGADFNSITLSASAPEPATLSLMGLGIAGIAIGLARRKRK